MPENVLTKVIEAEKATVKTDVRLLLHKLTSLIDNGDSHHYQSLISSIYNELDDYGLQDMIVWRDFIAENVDSILASRVTNKKEEKTTKSIVASITNMKVIGDAAGNFYVSGVENGVEKIVFQTDDKNKADEFAKQHSAVASPILAADEDEDKVENKDKEDLEKNNGELENSEFDSIPSEKAVNEDEEAETEENPDGEEDPLNEAETEEEKEEKDLLDRYNELIDDAHSFLDEIGNVISEVPDLRPITELAQIKAEVTDILSDLEQSKIDSNIITGSVDKSDEDNLRNKLDESERVLNLLETKVLDVINKYGDNTSENVATDIQSNVEESIAASKEPAANEVPIEDVKDVNVEDIATNGQTEPDEDLPAAEDQNYNNVEEPSDDAPSDEDISAKLNGEENEDTDFNNSDIDEFMDNYDSEDKPEEILESEGSEEGSEEGSAASGSDVESMIDDLIGIVNVPGDKAQEFAEKVDEISSVIDDICAKAGIDDDLDGGMHFNNKPDNDDYNFEENNAEENPDSVEQMDKDIENKIAPEEEDVTQPDLLEGIDGHTEDDHTEDKDLEKNNQ